VALEAEHLTHSSRLRNFTAVPKGSPSGLRAHSSKLCIFTAPKRSVALAQ